MIEVELGLLLAVFWILFLLLMLVNYRCFTKYPDRVVEAGFGAGILESRGLAWFLAIELVAALFLSLLLWPFSLFYPIRYSYLLLGVLLGLTTLNLWHDYRTYKLASKK